jgi:hypothetical protein
MMSDAEEEFARPLRKRARRSNNEDDGVGAEKKTRGRPRVNKPESDATAADVSVFIVHLFRVWICVCRDMEDSVKNGRGEWHLLGRLMEDVSPAQWRGKELTTHQNFNYPSQSACIST